MSSITFFFIFIIILAVILLIVNLILAPHNPYKEKNSVFECGFHSFLGQNRSQFSISFFIFALLFLLFDIEILLVYPYVTSSNTNEKYGLIFLVIFFTLLTLGFVFELGKDALKIPSRQNSNIIKLNIKRLLNAVKFFDLYQSKHVVSSSLESLLPILPLIILSGILNGLVASSILINSNISKLNLLKGTRRRIIKLKISKFNLYIWVAIFIFVVLNLIINNYIKYELILSIKDCVNAIFCFLLCSSLTWHIVNPILKNNINNPKKIQISSEFKLILDLFTKNTRNLRILFLIITVIMIVINYNNNVDFYSIMFNISLILGPECSIFFMKFISVIFGRCFGYIDGWVFMDNTSGGAGNGSPGNGSPSNGSPSNGGPSSGGPSSGGGGNGSPNNGNPNNAAANNQSNDQPQRLVRPPVMWFFNQAFNHPSTFGSVVREIYDEDSDLFEPHVCTRVKNDFMDDPDRAEGRIKRLAWEEHEFQTRPENKGPTWNAVSENSNTRKHVKLFIIWGIKGHYGPDDSGSKYD